MELVLFILGFIIMLIIKIFPYILLAIGIFVIIGFIIGYIKEKTE